MFLNKRIYENNVGEYAKYLPETYRVQVSLEKFNSVAVYDVTGDEEKFFGIYLTVLHAGWIEMVWIYIHDKEASAVDKGRFIRHCVLSDKRYRGGDIKGAFVEVYMNEADEDTQNAIELAGMETRIVGGNVYEFDLSMVGGKQMLKKSASRMECIPLKKADDIFRERTELVMHADDRPVPIPYFVNWDAYDEDVSFIAVKDKKPCGAMMISEESAHLVIQLCYSSDPIALPAMIYYSLEAALKKYGGDKKVLVPVVLNRTAPLVEHLVPEATRGQIINGIMRF